MRLEAPTEVANFTIPTERGTPDNNISSISAVIDCTRYSSLKKLIPTTGYLLRFVNNLKKRVRKQGNQIDDSVLTVDEYNEALLIWIKNEQSLMREQSNYSKLCASLRLF